ncbi:MAG: hypothetical protein RBU37_14285 [Myxococcota bacterium]|jgi:hypothetical protein|nr:hypothetical protein [Myxococcota bacterium]
MEVTPTKYDQFNDRIAAKGNLAEALLQPKHETRRNEAGLQDQQLLRVVELAHEAAKFDNLQRLDFARQSEENQALLARRNELAADRKAIQSRLPAIIEDLAHNPETATQAGILARVGFQRFRMRSVALSDDEASKLELEDQSSDDDNDAQPQLKRKRVARTDWRARAQADAALAQALLDSPAVVEAFAARALPLERLQRFAANAQDLGKSDARLLRSDYTELEAKAVAELKALWKIQYRMIRVAIAGAPELEKLYSAC